MKTLVEVTLYESEDEKFQWEQVGPTVAVTLFKERTLPNIAEKLRELADFYDGLVKP